MSDSDDYIPTAEDNLSNMSDMAKSSDHSEVDLDEINDVLLKNLESDVFHMQNEVKQRDHEMQKLLDELQKKFYAEKDLEFAQVTEAYEQRVRELLERIEELEETTRQEREHNEKYFAVVETLENENEKLREDNRRQQAEIFALNDKIQKMAQVNVNRSTANSSGFINGPTSPIASHAQLMQRNAQGDRNKQGLVLELEDVSAVSDFDATGFLKPGENILHPIDDVWINKFEFVKEKLLNEQNRSKELEFMIVTQKNIIENTNENMGKLKQENKDLETRIEKQRSEIDGLNQNRIIEKTKIDSVITFCELMENCVFPQAELVEKLSELPLMIASYLKGKSATIAFNKDLSAQSKLVASAKKIKVILEQMEEKVEKGEKNYRVGLVASELDDIRHGITNLTQFLSKALPPQQESPPRNVPDTQYERRPYRMEGTNYGTYREDVQEAKTGERLNYNMKSSALLAKAVQNSSSLLWNFKRTHAGSRGASEER